MNTLSDTTAAKASADSLFAPSLNTRESAAAGYTVFADGNAPPSMYAYEWSKVTKGKRAGVHWPDALREFCGEEAWPRYAFGTANAAILLLLHRPGMAGQGAGLDHIPPRTPTLGGVPHAHVWGWSPSRDKTWGSIRTFVRDGLRDAGLNDALSMLMTANINVAPASTGDVDQKANRRGLAVGGPIEHVIRTTQPLLILACGRPVWDALDAVSFRPEYGGTPVRVTHPQVWNDVRHRDNALAPERSLLPALRALARVAR